MALSKPIIADTGLFVALGNTRDRHHAIAKQVMSALKPRLITTWPVLTEVCHLLPSKGVDAFMAAFELGAFELFALQAEDSARLRLLMRKYRELPMDLADASLVFLAEHLGSGDILTTDQRDFGAYRFKNHEPFRNLLLDPP